MTYTENRTKEVLSYSDRVTIAAVVTWDDCGKHTYSPDEIEGIRIEGETVWVKLSNKRSHPIERYVFRNILEAQRASIEKQLNNIVETEEAEVVAAEEEMSRIIHEAAQQEIEAALGILPRYDWTIPSDEEVALFPVAANGYHDSGWTADDYEF